LFHRIQGFIHQHQKHLSRNQRITSRLKDYVNETSVADNSGISWFSVRRLAYTSARVLDVIRKNGHNYKRQLFLKRYPKRLLSRHSNFLGPIRQRLLP